MLSASGCERAQRITSGARAADLEQGLLRDGPTGLPVEARAVSVWLEAGSRAQVVQRPQPNDRDRLPAPEGKP